MPPIKVAFTRMRLLYMAYYETIEAFGWHRRCRAFL